MRGWGGGEGGSGGGNKIKIAHQTNMITLICSSIGNELYNFSTNKFKVKLSIH